MYALMDSFSPLVFVYFILIALLGGIFVVQLFLAVIFEEFLKAQQVQHMLLGCAHMCMRMRMRMHSIIMSGSCPTEPHRRPLASTSARHRSYKRRRTT